MNSHGLTSEPQRGWCRAAMGIDAEAVGELHEVGIAELGAGEASFEAV